MEAHPIRSLSDEFTRSTLGHGARLKRLLRVSDAFGKAPSASFPALSHNPREAKRGYEFLGNPLVLPDDVLRGHVLNTLDRCATHRRVLLVMDMTELDYTAHRATRGLGSIGDGDGRGIHVLSVLALDASTGEPLGVLPPQRWVRPDVTPGRRKAESTYARSLRARESQYWVRAIRSNRDVLGPSTVGTRFVVVIDQGGDIFDNFAACRARDFGFVLRVYQDRSLVPTTDPADAPHLMARLAQQPVWTHKEVEVRAKPNRTARVARCAVRVVTVSIQPPQTQPLHTPPEVVTVVQVLEVDPPAGEDALCWNLATDAAVETIAAALQIVSEYELRWTVEDFHMGLKTGCAIESRQFQSRHAIENFLSLASAQVWQMLWLRHQARTKAPGPAAEILSEGQREALRELCATLPAQADARQTLIAIAKLGGYFGRKSDGPPGWRTIWKGFQYLTTYAEGFEAARNRSQTTLREPS